MSSEKSNILEQHGQSILASIVLVLLVWVGKTVSDNVIQTATMKAQLSSVVQSIELIRLDLQKSTDDRYRGSDARRDLNAIYTEINKLNSKVERIDREQSSRGPRISRLEAEAREKKGE